MSDKTTLMKSTTEPTKMSAPPKPKQPTVGIFVLHHEKDDLTKGCVESWYGEAQDLGADIFVIDNGSPEPFKWNKKGVKTVRHAENLFLIEAFNVAIEAQKQYDITICVTNDTLAVGHPLLKGLVDVLADEKVGVVAPGTNDRGAGTLYVKSPLDKPDHETKHVDNTVWAWRGDVVSQVGLPSCEGHTHRACWACNKEFAFRLRNAGYKVIAATGSAYVRHAHDGGQDRVADNAGRQWLSDKLGGRFAEAW